MKRKPVHALPQPLLWVACTVVGLGACAGAGGPAPTGEPIPPGEAAPPSDLPFHDPGLPLEERVADLVGRLTLEEKAAQMQHESPAIPRLGVPAYDWWSEALHGVARAGKATVFPQAIGMAATWDTELMARTAEAIALEARAKHEESVRLGSRGIYEGLTFFSPNINIFRDPRWGRGMETYGEDPYLTGRLAVAFIRGLQGDDPFYLRTVATAKHYAVHSGPEPDRHAFDAVVSERDLRETYLPAFQAAVVEGGAESVMCAYNRVYGDPACASRRLLETILREEWDFGGYVVSDCWAVSDIHTYHGVTGSETESAAISLAAGTDITCGPEYRSLPEAVRAGLVSEEVLDRSLARLFGARIRLGMFDPPEQVPWAGVDMDVVDSDAHQALARESAVKSMVLLKNQDGILPLSGAGSLAIIGPGADDVELLLANYNGWPAQPVTPRAGLLRAARARGIDVRYTRGADLAEGVPSPVEVPASVLRDLTASYYATPDFTGEAVVRDEAQVDHQWWREAPLPGLPRDGFSVRWTASLVPPVSGRYALGARVMGGMRLFVDDSLVVEFTDRHVVATHTGWVDLEVGVPHQLVLEYSDRRPDAMVQLVWATPGRERLASAVDAARNADVALLFLGLSPRLEGEEMPVEVPGFAGGDRITLGLPATQQELLEAVVATGTPTVLVLMSGSALAVPWAVDHVPAILQAWYPGQAAGEALADVLFGAVSPGGRLPVTFYRSVEDLPDFSDYSMEGRTYRHFTGEPLFPFGHGLSYAHFRYGEISVPAEVAVGDDVELSVTVENTTTIPADEVVQLYLTDLESSVRVPVRTLVGFHRIHLAPGERRRLHFTVPADAFTVLDETGQRVWEPGDFTLSVGGKQPGQTGWADASTTEVVTATLRLGR